MKRKIRLLTTVGLVVGLIIFLSSYIRWINIYNDLSNAFFGMGLGVIIMAFAYVYQRFSEIEDYVYQRFSKIKGTKLNE